MSPGGSGKEGTDIPGPGGDSRDWAAGTHVETSALASRCFEAGGKW